MYIFTSKIWQKLLKILSQFPQNNFLGKNNCWGKLSSAGSYLSTTTEFNFGFFECHFFLL